MLDRLLRNAEMNDSDFHATREVLLSKLGILLNGAAKHGNQQVANEFEPLLAYWDKQQSGLASC